VPRVTQRASVDRMDMFDWSCHPEFRTLPVPMGSGPDASVPVELPFDDPAYVERRQEMDGQVAQVMEPPPQHQVPHWTTLCSDGLQLTPLQLSESCIHVKRRTIKRHRDGTVETYEDDGTVRTEHLDGKVTTLHPCGRVETELLEPTVDGKVNSSRHASRRRKVCNNSPFLQETAEDRPDVIMFGGQNVLPDMQEEVSLMARRGEMGMTLGSEKVLHDERSLKVPCYLRHFAGDKLSKDWSAPEVDVEREEIQWRKEYYRELKDPDHQSEREKLLDEFKFRKSFKRTEVKQEEWNFERAAREDAFSERLRKLQQNITEEKARSAKRDAKVHAREERLVREQKEAKEALRKLEEEQDLENRVFPDCVPAYLMDRPAYFFYPSKLAGNKRVLAEAQQPIVVVVGGASKGGEVHSEESDEEIAIVQCPPDDADAW